MTGTDLENKTPVILFMFHIYVFIHKGPTVNVNIKGNSHSLLTFSIMARGTLKGC